MIPISSLSNLPADLEPAKPPVDAAQESVNSSQELLQPSAFELGLPESSPAGELVVPELEGIDIAADGTVTPKPGYDVVPMATAARL